MRTGLRLACVLGSLASCGFEIPRTSHVNRTEIAAVRQTVELGPLSPERIGPLFAYDDEIPIAEALPGDLVVLEAIVIDVDGVRLPEDEIETLWVQCGSGECERTYQGFAAPEFDVPCEELALSSEYTTDSICLLGTGSARFDFVAPDPGYEIFVTDYLAGPTLSLYGVAAWKGRRAIDCWARRRGDNADLDRCEFIEQNITYGPEWALYEYVEAMSGWPPNEDPLLDLLKVPANRVPRAPELAIMVDNELVATGRPPLDIIPVRPSSAIAIALTFDVTSQLFQGEFVYGGSELTYIFVPELINSRTLTTNAIERLGPEFNLEGNESFHYLVDPSASPGISRVLIGWRDTRRGNDILTVEFEVE